MAVKITKSEMKRIMQDPRVFVPYWFGLDEQQDQSEGLHFDKLFLDYRQIAIGLKDEEFKALTEKELEKGFSEYLRKMPLLSMQKISEHLKFTGDDLTNVEKWVDAVAKNSHPNDVQVIAHWCWQVKRKALKLPIKHHIMPIVVGKQGSGKTMAISKLIAPWEVLRLSASVDMLNDPATCQSLANHCVVMFDELAGVQRVDMNTLKRQISTDTNSYRPLYRQNMVTVPQRCSFIGASNTHIDEAIIDATGMRRFYQIVSGVKTDWDGVNSVDYEALWRGIDENRADGYLTGDVLQAVHNTQAAYVPEDDVESFISAYGLQSEGPKQEVEAREVFAAYLDWASASNLKFTFKKQTFNRYLKNRGIPSRDGRAGTSRVLMFSVCSNSILFGKNVSATNNVLEWKAGAV